MGGELGNEPQPHARSICMYCDEMRLSVEFVTVGVLGIYMQAILLGLIPGVLAC